MKKFILGNRFKELRLEKKLTQSELVKDFNQKFYRNYTATAISRYENNKRLPEYDALKDFAEYFDVSVAYLIGESDIRKNCELPFGIFSNQAKSYIAKELYPFIKELLMNENESDANSNF